MRTATKILELSCVLKRVYVRLDNGQIYIESALSSENSELALTSGMTIDGIINLLARTFGSNAEAIRQYY